MHDFVHVVGCVIMYVEYVGNIWYGIVFHITVACFVTQFAAVRWRVFCLAGFIFYLRRISC